MRFRRFVPLLASVFLFSGTFVETVNAQSSNVIVSVTGTGSSIDEAKSDAIRQALQQTMKQLVVVDRAVSEDRILRDKVMSTMNGYIERFNQSNTRRVANGYAVDAEITVSASRIENFIGITTGGSGSIEGGSLLSDQNRRIAQIQAEKLQAKARGEIFDNVIRSFPSTAMSVRTLGISLSDNDPNKLKIDVKVIYKPDFVNAVEGIVKTFAEVECPPAQRQPNIRHDVAEKATRAKMGRLWDRDCPGDIGQTMYRDHSAHSFVLPRFGPDKGQTIYRDHPDRPIVCLGYTSAIRCYELSPGDYCMNCNLKGYGSSLVLYGRFVDSIGQSVNTSGSCLKLQAEPRNLFGTVIDIRGDLSVSRELYFKMGYAAFDFTEKTATITVPTSEFDLQKAKYFVAVAAIHGPKGNYGNPGEVTSMLPFQDDQQSGCALLDEAVQQQLLMGFGAQDSDSKEKSTSARPNPR